MRILLTSDTHLGITTTPTLRKFFRRMAKEEFDVLVHCGDYSGGFRGADKVRSSLKMMREVIPDKPIVSCSSNHEMWSGKPEPGNMYPTFSAFNSNQRDLKKFFKKYNVHYLDVDGLYINEEFPHVVLAGHGGWYKNPNPPTNDQNFLPQGISGDTNRFLLNEAARAIETQIEELDTIYDPEYHEIVFCSHFGVVRGRDDYKGGFDTFAWDEAISKLFIEKYNCKYFLEGHSHKRHEGPIVYNSGSDYCAPKYLIIEV